jgi:hypothetical protein
MAEISLRVCEHVEQDKDYRFLEMHRYNVLAYLWNPRGFNKSLINSQTISTIMMKFYPKMYHLMHFLEIIFKFL